MRELTNNQRAGPNQNHQSATGKKVPVEFSDEAAGFAKALKQLFNGATRNQATAPKPPKLKNRHGCPPNKN